MNAIRCQSCSMPLQSADDHALGDVERALCRHCATESGDLQPFEERLERMMQWTMRKEGVDRAAAEASARTYMRSMPAWKDHPALRQ